jgi:dienelactone hydrolase
VTGIDDQRPSADERRRMLSRLLGGFAPTTFALRERHAIAGSGGFRAERLVLSAPDGATVRGILTGPAGAWRGQPAVLYCHAHGNRYGIGAAELIEGRPALLPEPYGPALARRGVVALSIDMPCFGERAAETESALSKRLLLQGATLFGRMLCDLAGAFDLLSATQGVDRRRIGVFGFSMGATHAFWLGALETGAARIAHACAFADLEDLTATGAHDLHGPYMTVPGLLPAIRTGEIAGLCAPRPQLALIGALDPLTPPAALRRAVADIGASYRHAQDALRIVVAPDAGHTETPAMRDAVVDFLAADRYDARHDD